MRPVNDGLLCTWYKEPNESSNFQVGGGHSGFPGERGGFEGDGRRSE